MLMGQGGCPAPRELCHHSSLAPWLGWNRAQAGKEALEPVLVTHPCPNTHKALSSHTCFSLPRSAGKL